MNISTLFGNNFTNSKNIPSAPVDNLKVLFIGNSYTFRNDVPGKVEKLAEAANLTLEAQVAAKGGWNLKKHSDFFEPEYLETSEKIKNPPDGGWDVVVINEQSQRTSKSIEKMCRDTFQYALILTNEIRKYSPNAKIQWYVTWARAIGDNKNCKDNKQVCTFNGRYLCVAKEPKLKVNNGKCILTIFFLFLLGMQNAITTTYESLACMTRPSQLAPVGEAFREFRKLYQNEFFDLYKGWFEPGDCYEPKSGPKCHGTDEWDHHASNMGSYLSACVHFSTLFGVPCKGNTFR